MWAVVRQWKLRDRIPSALVTKNMHWKDPLKFELYLLGLSSAQRWEFFEEMAVGLRMPEIRLTAAEDEVIRYQTKAPGHVPTGLNGAADYMVDQMCDPKGRHMLRSLRHSEVAGTYPN